MQPDGGTTKYGCGVAFLTTQDPKDSKFWADLGEVAAGDLYAHALLFFSKTSFDPEELCARMDAHCPGLKYAACSTAGELTAIGNEQGNLIAILFPKDRFEIDAVRISGIRSIGMERIVDQVSAAKKRFVEPTDTNVFALCLIDGLSVMEEAVTAAFHWGLDDVPLLGGSAGDDMRFAETSLILNGEIGDDCALLLLVKTSVPFQIFKTDNFVPTSRKLVVTRSDPERRIIHEFNAADAASEYARVVGIDPADLSPMSFASHPLVVRVGGEYYCRSVQKMNDDGSLSFFCAIDDGIVLTVAEPAGMTRTTREAFEDVKRQIGGIDFVLGFDCVLRRIDAQNRQVTHRIAEIYKEHNVIGFNTYGEQYLSMHLNQTFTGIAFGQAAENGSG
jgi:hypothetical protein